MTTDLLPCITAHAEHIGLNHIKACGFPPHVVDRLPDHTLVRTTSGHWFRINADGNVFLAGYTCPVKR